MKTSDTLQYRDVHSNQQLDRGRIEQQQSLRGTALSAVALSVLVAIVAWVLYSLIVFAFASFSNGAGSSSESPEAGAYYDSITRFQNGEQVVCYAPRSEEGYISSDDCYASPEDVPVPEWYSQAQAQAEADAAAEGGTDPAVSAEPDLGVEMTAVTPMKLLFSLGGGLLTGAMVGTVMSRKVKAMNLSRDMSDINQHHNDQHIATPEEMQRMFDFFPDAGAHSSVQPNSQVSHVMLDRKGLKNVQVTKRAEKDIYDKDGELEYYAGEAMVDEDGEPITTTEPLIDMAFGDELFDASGLPKDKELRKKYVTTTIPYNPDGSNRDKLGAYKRVSDMINADWEFPDYEVQRPGGAYLVDTAPINTMVLAITRAGKGQTYIEPMLDMWSREKNPSNMVINDPKGELLVKNYIPFVVRGYQPIAFNLINPTKTDIYNPLGMAADAAREGDSTKCALYVENIADVFFPTDGGEDPVWPNAANNAFKRAAYGLIDYYLEEERELREYAVATNMDPGVLEQRLDDMWGRVTLYNCYQLFVQLTSKKIKNPKAELEKDIKAGVYNDDEIGLEQAQEEADAKAFLWEDKPEQDMLTLFFNASEALPTNTMRTLIGNANNALRAMAGAEKMLASVYGIAITAMSFFTDPTISTLTSGKPSQNTDLGGLSFPRRFGVRFSQNYLKRDHLHGMQAVWSAYGDPGFQEDLGKDFTHEDTVSREGWARYYFKGRFPEDKAWVKLELRNPQTKMLVRTYYFEFTKSYQLSLDGRRIIKEVVTGEKQVKNGVLRELKLQKTSREVVAEDGTTTIEEQVTSKPGSTMYPQPRLVLAGSEIEKRDGESRAITQMSVRYSDKPKAVFLVTPPHLMKYAKLILVLLKQLVDLNFDKSYMTKSNQKPLYRTRFMLDELGNLQSEGKGISGFETMLSIGLGQEQQFTLILQTLQQLRDVYGDSVDKIVQGNVANIVFLKSTDDTMIETLEKMSGKTHKSYTKSKSITKDVEKVAFATDGKVSYTYETVEEPVISYNDFASLPPRNSIVLSAGNSPIWNRNDTILPMSWKLYGNTITHPGNTYTLQTIPTLSSADEFDVRMNQPDFRKMLEKRMLQAQRAADAKTNYAEAYGYQEIDIERLDPDIYSDEVMTIISSMTAAARGLTSDEHVVVDPDDYEAAAYVFDEADFLENTEVKQELAVREADDAEYQSKRYADGTISRSMLVGRDGTAFNKSSLEESIITAYRSAMTELHRDTDNFQVQDGSLCSADGSQVYISEERSEAHAEALKRLNDASEDAGSRVFAEKPISVDELSDLSTVRVQPAFYRFLASLPSWSSLAEGEFERAMAIEMHRDEDDV